MEASTKRYISYALVLLYVIFAIVMVCVAPAGFWFGMVSVVVGYLTGYLWKSGKMDDTWNQFVDDVKSLFKKKATPTVEDTTTKSE